MKILNLILQHDKLKHFFIGTLIFIASNYFLEEIISLIIVVSIAFLKELYDKFIKKSMFSFLDIIYTILTALLLTIF